jgi:NADH:ubiquinone oxidoreductase subunit F (NADH-binding)/(2Fe-2S) ferredoxin/NAD-dependent dihydropyrimidine dehydrogenase PreA subunit
MPRLDSPAALETLQRRLIAARAFWPVRLILSSGTCGQASGSLAVLAALRQRLDRPDLRDSVHVRVTGCQGFCEQEPLLILDPLDVIYCRVKPQDIEEIVSQTLLEGRIVERLLYVDPVSGARVRREADIPFFAKQDRALISKNRWVDPCNVGDYIAAGGYSALAAVLSWFAPQRVIEEIKASGLRGRGGSGYPTGRKWEQCRSAPGEHRYVICNADEGDPGAYMDRGLLEGNPHLILEGMLIGAYAVGSEQGFVYVRNEYPLAVQNVRVAIEQAREMGLLGHNILGTGFSFDVKVARGGGAFVCGESTALMASLEGKVGEPRAKDVHTVERGYLDQPSLLNNVETWANVPDIIRRGPAWFAARGTETSKGSKIFALTGHVKHTGLVEVRMGTTLREIIFDIGGGPRNGKSIKAVQTGGPSGGCLPVSLFDLPVDFEALADAGSMMGSGGMVVIDESVCMVDFAKYFLSFLQDESCGKCVPCRVGIGRMREILEDFCEGRGTMAQFAVLEELAWTVQNTSLCALGKTAPNPVLSTLRYFRDEYLAHVEERHCPAGACKALIRYEIDDALCGRCGECVAVCPHGAIREDEGYAIDHAACQKCGICEDTCAPEAIRRIRGLVHA